MWHKAIPSSSSWCFLSVLKPYFLCNTATTTTTTTITRSPKSQISMKTLDESDVGIFCYISHLPGFRGVLKQRLYIRACTLNYYYTFIYIYIYKCVEGAEKNETRHSLWVSILHFKSTLSEFFKYCLDA